jgi:hypothetical protein
MSVKSAKRQTSKKIKSLDMNKWIVNYTETYTNQSSLETRQHEEIDVPKCGHTRDNQETTFCRQNHNNCLTGYYHVQLYVNFLVQIVMPYLFLLNKHSARIHSQEGLSPLLKGVIYQEYNT